MFDKRFMTLSERTPTNRWRAGENSSSRSLIRQETFFLAQGAKSANGVRGVQQTTPTMPQSGQRITGGYSDWVSVRVWEA